MYIKYITDNLIGDSMRDSMSYTPIIDKKSNVTATINNYNGQLISLKNIVEYIHPGGRAIEDPLRDVEGWSNSDLTMFPIVSASKNHKIIYDGKTYPLDQHGIIRAMTPSITYDKKTASQVSIKYVYDLLTKIDNSLKHQKDSEKPAYMTLPFGFNLELIHSINDQRLNTAIRVKNNSNNAFCYALGRHPAFKSCVENSKKGMFYNIKGDPIMHKDNSNKNVPLTLDILLEISKVSAKFLENQNYVLFYNEEEDSGIELQSDLESIMLWSPNKSLFCMEPITEKLEKGSVIDLSPKGSYKNILAPGEEKKYSMEIKII